MMPGVTYLPAPSMTSASAGASTRRADRGDLAVAQQDRCRCGSSGPAAVRIVTLRITVGRDANGPVGARERIGVRRRERRRGLGSRRAASAVVALRAGVGGRGARCLSDDVRRARDDAQAPDQRGRRAEQRRAGAARERGRVRAIALRARVSACRGAAPDRSASGRADARSACAAVRVAVGSRAERAERSVRARRCRCRRRRGRRGPSACAGSFTVQAITRPPAACTASTSGGRSSSSAATVARARGAHGAHGVEEIADDSTPTGVVGERAPIACGDAVVEAVHRRRRAVRAEQRRDRRARRPAP